MPYRTILLSFVLIFGIAVWGQAESFWPMFQRDTGHTGVAPVSTPDDLEVVWSIDAAAVDIAQLVIGLDGSVWMVGAFGSIDRYSVTGERILHIFGSDLGFKGEFSGHGSPAVLADGTLIVMAGVRNELKRFVATLYAIQPDGDVRWTLPFDGQLSPESLLTLGPDGRIYAGCPTCLYAVSQEGSVAWSYEPDTGISTIPAVATDGSVYFGAGNTTLYCLTSEGLLSWTFRPEPGIAAPIDSVPTLGDNGRIYFAASGSGFYCLNSDGSVEWSYPVSRFCYTSPILFSDGSVVFHEMTEHGPVVTGLRPDGSRRWSVQLPGTSQAPLSSPAADQDGNVFLTCQEFDAGTSAFCFSFARVDSDGNYAPLYSEFGQRGRAGGPCIGEDGTIYCQVGTKLVAFGKRWGTSMGIKTDAPGYAAWLRFWVKVSVSITNAEIATPLDCYIAFKRPDTDQLLFYPFWSPDPSLAAMQFRPLPGDCFFQNIEIAHMPSNLFQAGDYQLFAAFFQPETFNLVGDIASCLFSVSGSQVPTGRSAQPNRPDLLVAFEPSQNGTPPTIGIWTDKASYSAGEVLNLRLGLENQGLGMPFDLYIAATLDGDPSGTLYFFPTWATSPAFTNIGFLPLAHGASLPALTIMHLALPDALPRGGYKFLAAFFHVGTFELASQIAEARWTLM